MRAEIKGKIRSGTGVHNEPSRRRLLRRLQSRRASTVVVVVVIVQDVITQIDICIIVVAHRRPESPRRHRSEASAASSTLASLSALSATIVRPFLPVSRHNRLARVGADDRGRRSGHKTRLPVVWAKRFVPHSSLGIENPF